MASRAPIALLLTAVWLAGCDSEMAPPAPASRVATPEPRSPAGGAPAAAAVTDAATDADAWADPQPLPMTAFAAVQRPAPKSIEEAVATLEAIRTLYDTPGVPDPIGNPITSEEAMAIARGIQLLRTQLPADIAWIQRTEGIKVPGADKFTAQQFDNPKVSVLSVLEDYIPTAIERTLSATRESLAGTYVTHMDFIRRAADVDMSDATKVRNLLSNEPTVRSRDETIRLVGIAVEGSILFDMILDGKSAWVPKRTEYRETVNRYRSKVAQAADAIMPPSGIEDAALAAIAAEVLGRPEYKLARPERTIVNALKKPHARDHCTVDFEGLKMTRESYRWEEFQVATIEKHHGLYFLYYNTLMNYKVGPSTVPAGKWTLGARYRSAPIAEANIRN